jgi:hypothetical protein
MRSFIIVLLTVTRMTKLRWRRWTMNIARMGAKGNAKQILMKERDNLETLYIDNKIILKGTLGKQKVRVWTESIELSIRKSAGLLYTRQ